MIAKVRNLHPAFEQKYIASKLNLMVSGCSFTYNNSESHVCTWPYYLRDICGFHEVYDCSQSGAGTNHIFNSLINEIETNDDISPDNTLVIVMWSGLSRTDVIAGQDITERWHHMSNYHFDRRFATLSLFNQVGGDDLIDNLCKDYKTLVDLDAQIYESALKILGLDAYLRHKDFEFIFTSWINPSLDLETLSKPMQKKILGLMDTVQYLGSYAQSNQKLESDGHPSPDGHLGWTKDELIPCLQRKNIIHEI